MYIVYVTFGDGCGLSLVGCHLSNFKIGRLDPGFYYLSVSHYFVPHFCMSECRLKFTKHMGLIVMLCEE
jgi:hypothetical protein